MKEPIGYAALQKMFSIEALPHYRISYRGGRRETHYEEEVEIQWYPSRTKLDTPIAHLEWALKHEGFHFPILKGALSKITRRDLKAHIDQKPTSHYARVLWYLYESFFNVRLDLPNIKKGPYVDLLDPKEYYTCKGVASPRHRVNDNKLGNFSFCPFVRRTKALVSIKEQRFRSQIEKTISGYDESLLSRASDYLYNKETMSSFAIEKEKPTQNRADRFMALLRRAGKKRGVAKERFIELQNEIVDPKFAASDYRHFQNYVGHLSRSSQWEPVIDYFCPPGKSVPSLMEGLISSYERMKESPLPTLLIAATISFAFVLIHPFEDGNGRLHRFLIHQIFAELGLVPSGLIFPVSAVMLKERKEYDEILESFSRPIGSLVGKRYKFNSQGELEIGVDLTDCYRYPDLTHFVEYLAQCLKKTIETEFKSELAFLSDYDQLKRAIQNSIDMPDAKIDLLIQLSLQNRGKLAKRKRELFHQLTDQQLARVEKMIHKSPLIKSYRPSGF